MTVDSYLEAQPPLQYQLLTAARACLLRLDDRIREEIKWQIPFYSYHGPWCYLTTVPRQPYIHLGLLNGAQLADPAHRLTGHDRKLVRHLRFHSTADIQHPETLALLHQSLLLRAGR